MNIAARRIRMLVVATVTLPISSLADLPAEAKIVAVPPVANPDSYTVPEDGVLSTAADNLFDLSWGSSGSADGQFNFPAGVAVGSGDDAYVTDTANNRIQVFTPCVPSPGERLASMEEIS